MLFYNAAMKSCICFVAMILGLGQLLGASEPINQQEAIARLERAISKTNIFELPSFAMKADVEIEDHGKLVKGTYELLWNGPDQWREGIAIPGYTEVQAGGKGTIWVQRSVDFIPISIYTLHQALGFGSSVGLPQSMSLVQLALTSRDTIKKTSTRKDHGDELTCFEIEDERKHSSEICVSDSTETVVRAPFMFADSDLQPVGAKTFPRLLILRHGKEVVANVKVSELASPAQFPPATFSPPAGVSAEVGCMNPSMPHVVKKPAPEYPTTARQQHREGTVSFDVLIGTNGIPQIRKLIERAGIDLDDSSRNAVSLWRYDSATCNGKPVEVETVLQVNFALTH